MKKILNSSRSRAITRWSTIAVCVALMIYGVYNPVEISAGSCIPLDAHGLPLKIKGVLVSGKRQLFDNTFLMVGGFGLAVIFGLVELIKVWRNPQTPAAG